MNINSSNSCRFQQAATCYSIRFKPTSSTSTLDIDLVWEDFEGFLQNYNEIMHFLNI
jgi:hypothetical protein